jgi:hypothetical protein
MADSVREQIMKHLHTTLETIRKENGYSDTLASVQRFQQIGQSKGETPLAILMEGLDQVEHELSGNGQGVTVRNMTVGVELTVVQDEQTDARSASEIMNALIADVQKAVLAEAGVQRGGVAIDTRPGDVTPIAFVEGVPELTTLVEFEVRYRYRRDDPTQGV